MKLRPVFLIFAASLCLITGTGVVYAQQQSSVPQKTQLPKSDVDSVSPVTFEELRFFVRDWRRYSRWLKNEGRGTGAVAYAGVSTNPDYPPEAVRWLEERNWAPDRFFLIERRIRETLSVLQKEEKRRVFTEQMQRQIRLLQADTSKTPEQKAALQKQYLKNVQNVVQAMKYQKPVSDKEMTLFKLNREVLERVMDM